ncbi:MAG: glycosyltransferase family 4 protein [Firmicutes bacterium]|nr:glycosyltransferase family 4 protein [Bacillota bacterium]MCL5971691.1 glycosyltransferase family 4 protein [Bacillota bacterium]
MRVTFVLPNFTQVPIGGYKVVYQYANELVKLGHHVVVVQSPLTRFGAKGLDRIRAYSSYLRQGALGGHSYLPRWLTLDPRINVLWRPSLDPAQIPDGDAVIATAWQTSEWVAAYPSTKGRKFYLIQHLETWSGGNADRVIATWTLPLTKIVIAKWLWDYAHAMGESAIYIPNGSDPDEFNVDVPIMARNGNHVGMMYHRAAWKGSQDGLKALDIVRGAVPELQVTLFGTEDRPHSLPESVRYVVNPTRQALRQIYNQVAIFIGPSWTEGWGLPPMEAAMCGAALAVTDIGGHREYARHLRTALLSPPHDPEVMAENVKRLIVDPPLRWKLAEEGRRWCQNLSWEKSGRMLEQALSRNEGPPGGQDEKAPTE